MTCADLARIINSDQIQSTLRQQKSSTQRTSKGKKNPLKNKTLMQIVNPASKTLRAAEEKAVVERQKARDAGLEQSFKDAHQIILDEIKAGLIDQDDDEEG